MKKPFFNHQFILLLLFFLFPILVLAQKNKFSLVARIPVQIDFQKENISFPVIFESKEQKVTVLNYGIDALIEMELDKNVSIYAGLGYFRDKFNFKKFYDHTLLNAGRDSIPIGTSTYNYIYNLVRFPLGLSYKISSTQKIVYKVGGEIVFNYSFQKIYNGTKPFPGANNKLSHFQYSGISLNLFTCVKFPVTKSSFLELEPYVRLYHTYKKDEILYENPSESIRRSIDAVGLSIKYSLSFKK